MLSQPAFTATENATFFEVVWVLIQPPCICSSNLSSYNPPPPVIRVNRRACRFGPYKSPRRPHPPPRASQVSPLTWAYPLLTHRRPLDQSSHPTRVHFGPLASAAKMGSHDGVVPWLHCTRRQAGSKYTFRGSLLHAPVPCFEYLCRFAVAGEWVKMDAVKPVFGDDDEEGI
jgi:hypothetical protein